MRWTARSSASSHCSATDRQAVRSARTSAPSWSGLRLHRREPLESDEVAQRHGLSLTTPSRTVLDLASCLGPRDLERVLARALKLSLLVPDSLAAMLHRHPHRRRCRTLQALLQDAAGPDLTRSDAEARFLALLRKGGVPRPHTDAIVSGLEVDFFRPDRGLVVEIDGFAFHGNRSAFENDRRRDSTLATEGLDVIRFTWRQIHVEPDRVLVRLSMTLGARARWTERRREGAPGPPQKRPE